MYGKRILCIAAICLLSYATSIQAQSAQYPDAHSVVEEEASELIYRSPNDATYRQRLRVTVFNEKGLKAANFFCTCSSFCTLRKFSGAFTDSQGEVRRKIKKSDLQRSEYSTELASDSYFYYYEYTPPQYPFTATYEFEMTYTDALLGFPPFLPQSQFHQPVEQASYTLSLPKGTTYRYHTTAMTPEISKETTATGEQLIRLQVKNLPALTDEPYSPPLRERMPRVDFVPETFCFEKTQGSMESWNSYGKWQYGLLEGRDRLPAALVQQLRERTSACRNDREKVAAVYDYLAATTRYVSIQLGIGGLQPAPAEEVYRTGFGDCKALSNYARAMLATLGIPAYYTVISTDNERFFPDFPSANQANHVILQVPLPGDTLWLECTNPKLPLGYIHQNIAGHDALLVKPEGGVLCRLPAYADSLHTETHCARITIDDAGTAHMDVQQRSCLFQYEDKLGMLRATPDKQQEWLRSQLALGQATIHHIRCIEHKRPMPEMEINYEVDTRQFGNRTGRRLFIPCNIFRRHFHVPTSTISRQQDIQTTYGYQDTDTLHIRLPKGYCIESLPANVCQQTPFGEFHVDIQAEAGEIRVVHRLLVKRGRYGKEEYGRFIAFREAVAKQYGAKIVLKKEE